MPYDPALADRVRSLLGARPGLTERRVFGSLAWFCRGNLAVGVSGEELIVRLSPMDLDEALAESDVRPFAPGGKSMKGWVLVGPDGTERDDQLQDWLERGWDFAGSLPAK